MKLLVATIPVFFLALSLHAQREGNDTIPGYIVKSTNDTVYGKLILLYKLIREKKQDSKQYESMLWHDRALFLDADGKEVRYEPTDISAYGWSWNDTTHVIFHSKTVTIPHKGAFAVKGSGIRFLRLEIEGPVSLYLYSHPGSPLGNISVYHERYLQRGNGELNPLKIKAWLAIAYNLTEFEDWFTGYPGLSQFKMKDMLPLEVWMLVDGYNKWREKNMGQ